MKLIIWLLIIFSPTVFAKASEEIDHYECGIYQVAGNIKSHEKNISKINIHGNSRKQYSLEVHGVVPLPLKSKSNWYLFHIKIIQPGIGHKAVGKIIKPVQNLSQNILNTQPVKLIKQTSCN